MTYRTFEPRNSAKTLLRCPRQCGTFGLKGNSDSSSATDDAVFEDTEEQEHEPEREAMRSLTPKLTTEETWPLEDLKPEDEVSLSSQVEQEDSRSLHET